MGTSLHEIIKVILLITIYHVSAYKPCNESKSHAPPLIIPTKEALINLFFGIASNKKSMHKKLKKEG